MTPPVRRFASRDALFDAAAEALADALREGVDARGRGLAALSGGSTPAPAYERLARLDLDWRRIVFTLVDERCVPLDHPASNEAMLRSALAPALAQGAALWPMHPQNAANAAAYAGLGDLDLALMGMGEDGHTASWFPDAEGLAAALDPSNQANVVALRAPQAAGAADRLSLSFAAITRARRVLLLITGEQKRAVYDAAERASAPVAALFSLGGKFEAWWAA